MSDTTGETQPHQQNRHRPDQRPLSMLTCPFCQAVASGDPAYCPSCGRPTRPAARSSATPASQSHAAGGDALKSFLAHTSIETKTLGVATLVAFIGMLLPWYSASAFGYSVSVNGFHRWGWLSFVAMLVAAAATAVMLGAGRVATGRKRQLRMVALVAGILEVLGAVAFWVDASGSTGGVSGSPSVGLFLTLIAGLVSAGVTCWTRSLTRAKARP